MSYRHLHCNKKSTYWIDKTKNCLVVTNLGPDSSSKAFSGILIGDPSKTSTTHPILGRSGEDGQYPWSGESWKMLKNFYGKNQMFTWKYQYDSLLIMPYNIFSLAVVGFVLHWSVIVTHAVNYVAWSFRMLFEYFQHHWRAASLHIVIICLFLWAFLLNNHSIKNFFFLKNDGLKHGLIIALNNK